MNLPGGWTLRTEALGAPSRPWYERSDGAYVWYSRDEYYSNPLNPRCRMWQAFLHDDSTNGQPVTKVRGLFT